MGGPVPPRGFRVSANLSWNGKCAGKPRGRGWQAHGGRRQRRRGQISKIPTPPLVTENIRLWIENIGTKTPRGRRAFVWLPPNAQDRSGARWTAVLVGHARTVLVRSIPARARGAAAWAPEATLAAGAASGPDALPQCPSGLSQLARPASRAATRLFPAPNRLCKGPK